MRDIRKRFCGDAVGDALRAIGRRRGDRDPVPGDFTERERFDMFRFWIVLGVAGLIVVAVLLR